MFLGIIFLGYVMTKIEYVNRVSIMREAKYQDRTKLGHDKCFKEKLIFFTLDRSFLGMIEGRTLK